uniref:Uncharacterized protein n=1 Tax=Tetraselmis chuii TaxID=63592 RepID=A0A7S1X1D4_9CHLO|mmetsp:Transcript_21962/g.39181  ORF Transcript_21962/g.39181 Transcript_21962/m.39181 type:complete len:155 (+) Transcript_21962:2-466(+)
MRRAIRIAQASCPGCKENFPELCPGTGDAKLLPMVENVSSRGKGSSRGVANRNASLRAIRPRIAGGGSPSPTSSAAPPRNLDSSINSLERDSDSGQGQRLSDPEVNSTPFNLWTTLSMRTIRTPSSLSDYDAEADDIAGSNERASSSKVSGSTA